MKASLLLQIQMATRIYRFKIFLNFAYFNKSWCFFILIILILIKRENYNIYIYIYQYQYQYISKQTAYTSLLWLWGESFQDEVIIYQYPPKQSISTQYNEQLIA